MRAVIIVLAWLLGCVFLTLAHANEVLESREFVSGTVSLVKVEDGRCESGRRLEVHYRAGFLPNEYEYFTKLMAIAEQLEQCQIIEPIDAADETLGYKVTELTGLIGVRVTSQGGYVRYGVQMASRINAIRGYIAAEGECSSTCSVAFFSTYVRVIQDGTKIGVHAPYIGNEYKDGFLSKWTCSVYDIKDQVIRSMLAGIADDLLGPLIVETKYNTCNPHGFHYFHADELRELGLSH